MKYLKFFVPFCFVLFSCANDKEAGKEQVSNDSTATLVKTESRVSFDEREFKALKFPLVLDTVFVEQADSSDRISYRQLRAQGLNFLKNELGERMEFTIDDFIRIDSIKEAGKYEEYIAGLDIGMTKRAIAYKIGVLNFKNGTHLFIWAYQLHSFEACPVFNYNRIVGTYVDNENKSTNFLLAEVSGGADPPVTGDERMWSVIKEDGTIDINYFSVDDDLDIPGQNTFRQTFGLFLGKGKVEITKNEKQETKGEKEQAN